MFSISSCLLTRTEFVYIYIKSSSIFFLLIKNRKEIEFNEREQLFDGHVHGNKADHSLPRILDHLESFDITIKEKKKKI
jgi:hypothetical protein